MFKNVVIIIPAYNEERNIKILVNIILKLHPKFKIIIIDDSESMQTKISLKTIKNKNVFFFHRKKKLGRGSAVLYGLKYAIKNFKDTNCFIDMDADFSHSPFELKKKIAIFNKKKADLLISSRYKNKSKIINWSYSRKILSKISNILANILIKAKVTDYTNGFRAYSKRAVKIILKNSKNSKNDFILLSEIILILNKNNYKIFEKSTRFKNRVRGESKVNIYLIFKSLIGLFKLYLANTNSDKKN